MRKLLGGLMALCLVILTSGPVQAQVDNFTAYNDGHVTLQYPVRWQATPFGDFNAHGAIFATQAVEVPMDDDGEPVLFENIALARAVMNGPVAGVISLPPAAVEGDPRTAVGELLGDYEIIRSERARPIQLDGATGIEMIGTVAVDEMQFSAHLVAFVSAERFVLFVGGSTADTFEENRATFAQMATSVHILTEDERPVAPEATLNDPEQPFFIHNGYGYSLAHPARWQPDTIETFDAALTVFCNPAVRLVNSDLEALLAALLEGDLENNFSPDLLACLSDGPAAVVLRIPVQNLEDLDEDIADPAQAFLQQLLNQVEDENVISARPLTLSGAAGAEMVATYGGDDDQRGVGVYGAAVVERGALVFIGGSAPLADFRATLPLFQNMAYSLTLKEVAGGGSGSSLTYGATVEATLTAGETAEWTFFGNAGDSVVIYIESGEFDSIMALYSPSGGLIGESDDYDGYNPRIEVTLADAGTYRIVVGAYSQDSGGVYTITLDLGGGDSNM